MSGANRPSTSERTQVCLTTILALSVGGNTNMAAFEICNGKRSAADRDDANGRRRPRDRLLLEAARFSDEILALCAEGRPSVVRPPHLGH